MKMTLSKPRRGRVKLINDVCDRLARDLTGAVSDLRTLVDSRAERTTYVSPDSRAGPRPASR
jgi:hypothetical protein